MLHNKPQRKRIPNNFYIKCITEVMIYVEEGLIRLITYCQALPFSEYVHPNNDFIVDQYINQRA